jgi:hypothetical protein
MDIARALTFITEDERWSEKLAIGVGIILVSGLLTPVLIGIVGFLIIAGYAIRLLQNVRDGQPHPLPEWNQWSEDFGRGLKVVVVTLIWSLPVVVVIVPMILGGALADSGGDAAEVVGSLILFGGVCLAAIYGLFVTLLTPGFTIAFARDEEIRSGLQLTEIWRWTQQNLGQILLVTILYLAGSFVLSLVAMVTGALLCMIGLVVTIPLGGLVTIFFQHHLYGQLARGTNHAVTPASVAL